MISGEGFSTSSTFRPHPDSLALSCRLYDGIRSCPSDQTPSCDGVTRRAGFSLIEIAIAFVIIGLLAGGILVGQSLIRAAELRSVVEDYNKYRLAVIIFEDRFRHLPGDMPGATALWGIADGTTGNDATCFDATSNGTTTCNGNGNKLIYSGNGAEQYHAWVHLKNAGLVEGSFTGRRVNDPRQAVPGVNVPRSKLSKNGGFTLYSLNWGDGDSHWYSGSYNPAITAGTQTNTVQAYAPLFKAEEAFDIDSKMDDGRPGLGRVRTFHSRSECVSSTDEADQNTATYNLTANSIACALIYSFDNPGQ
jgi:hypothetical protein